MGSCVWTHASGEDSHNLQISFRWCCFCWRRRRWHVFVFVCFSFFHLFDEQFHFVFKSNCTRERQEHLLVSPGLDLIRCVVDIFRIHFRTFHMDTISVVGCRAYNSFIHIVLTYSSVRGACVCMHRLLFMRNANKNKRSQLVHSNSYKTAMESEKEWKKENEHKEPHSSD